MNPNAFILALIILISTIAVVFAVVRFRQVSHYFSTFASGTLIAGAVSLTLGIVTIVLEIAVPGGPWIYVLSLYPLLALVGLFFGAIGLQSTGNRKYLAVAGVVMSCLALAFAFYLLFTGGLYYILTS